MTAEHDTATNAYAHLLLEHAPVGMAIFDAQTLHLLAANDSYHRFHRQRWQLTSRVGESLQAMLPQAECARIVNLFRHVVASGTAYRDEATVIIEQGDKTKYWGWSLEPIREHDEVGYVLASVSDVTAHVVLHQQAEQAYASLLKEHHTTETEHQRFYAILDQLPEGVLLIEAMTSKISYVNPAATAILGCDRTQLVGVPLNQLASLSAHLVPENQKTTSRWNFALIDALWGRSTSNQEFSILRPDGSEITVLSSAAPIRAASGLITEAVIVFQDITPVKKLEQQKNEFFAIANHELRTPLTVITGYAEILPQLAPEGGDATFLHAMTSIVQEGNHLMTLVDELLNVSRLEQTQMRLQKRYQDLLVPLKRLVALRRSTNHIHQLQLRIDDEQECTALLGWFDMVRIEQALNNLITNAIKYSPAGGEIEMSVHPRRNTGRIREVLLRVSDHGVGIAPHDLPHIFRPFYRADATDGSIGGFGIGLYLTREIVRGHGGRIWAESVKGQGSRFFVSLPLGEDNCNQKYIQT